MGLGAPESDGVIDGYEWRRSEELVSRFGDMIPLGLNSLHVGGELTRELGFCTAEKRRKPLSLF